MVFKIQNPNSGAKNSKSIRKQLEERGEVREENGSESFQKKKKNLAN